jgi:hypothetical protein
MFLTERKDPEELLYYQALSRRRGLDKNLRNIYGDSGAALPASAPMIYCLTRPDTAIYMFFVIYIC